MGEYQALEKLENAQKDAILPLLEVLPPDYDFEQRRPKKDMDEQLRTFGDKLKRKWGTRPALLDVGQLAPATRMADGRHPMTFLLDAGREWGAALTPVFTLESDAACQDALGGAIALDRRGAVLRCALEEALDPDFDDIVAARLLALRMELDALDLVLDLKMPAFDPQDALIGVLTAALTASYAYQAARSVTLMATSFPESMAEMKLPIQRVPRREWVLFKALLATLTSEDRRPGFGDYGIAAVKFAQGDMRFMRGAPNIRYAIDDAWLVARAKREKDGSNKAYPGLCGLITGSGQYHGAGFSAGAAYIEGCRLGTQKLGNPTVWKWVATNQHITKVVADLASLPGP
jgi:hypothetical protein